MKLNFKHLLLVGILLISMYAFSTNMVQATDVKVDETKTATVEQAQISKAITDPKEIIALIPNTITLDILESQIFNSGDYNSDDYYRLRSEKLLDEKINNILKENNVDLESMKITCYNDLGLDNETARKCTITLEDKNYKILAEKEIAIKYKNSDKYNNADEQYVMEKLKNVDFNLFLAKEIRTEDDTDYRKVVQENAKKVINDNNLTVVTRDVAGGGTDVMVVGFRAWIYKNDILYAIKDFEYVEGNMIVIPDNIQDTDEAYISYALPKIKEWWSNYTVKSVNKITGQIKQENDIVSMNIKNDGTFYKITLDDDDWARVVLKKANTAKVIDHVAISNNFGVILNGTNLDKNNSIYTEMQDKAKIKGYNNVLYAYELKLSSGSIKDNLTITFSLGTENDGRQAIVLHKKADGSYEEFTKTVKDGKIDVTVSELSPFMIALNDITNNNTTNRELDNEPKTGMINYTIFASIVAIISLCGIIVLKFKK